LQCRIGCLGRGLLLAFQPLFTVWIMETMQLPAISSTKGSWNPRLSGYRSPDQCPLHSNLEKAGKRVKIVQTNRANKNAASNVRNRFQTQIVMKGVQLP
jgi:hypothetical protein